MEMKTVWVDVARCAGCGACADVCPVGAIALVDGKACVDEELCDGCGKCVDSCPEGAIQHVLHVEMIPAPEHPAPTVHRPSPLAETAGAAVVVAGTGLLAKLLQALARWVEHWLTQRSAETRPPSEREATSAGGQGGGGRQRRRRRRGR